MDDDRVLELVREALAYADAQAATWHGTITMDDTLSDLGIDSISALEMAAYLEEKLGIQFPDDELSGMVDVHGIARLLRRHAGVAA